MFFLFKVDVLYLGLCLKMWIAGGGIEMSVKGYKLRRRVSFGDLMHSIVIIVNTNTLLQSC